MSKLNKEQSRERYRQLRALWSRWDPIGVVSPNDERSDEYDQYLGPTLRLLEQNGSQQEIADYLSFVVGEYMGLGERGVEQANPVQFAHQLINWFDKNWPHSHL